MDQFQVIFESVEHLLPPEQKQSLLHQLDELARLSEEADKAQKRFRREQQMIRRLLAGAEVEPGPTKPVIVEKRTRSGKVIRWLKSVPNPNWKG